MEKTKTPYVEKKKPDHVTKRPKSNKTCRKPFIIWYENNKQKKNIAAPIKSLSELNKKKKTLITNR